MPGTEPQICKHKAKGILEKELVGPSQGLQRQQVGRQKYINKVQKGMTVHCVSNYLVALRTPHCITPPAQVVRRVRDDTLAHNGSRVSCDIDSSGLFPFVPELSANGGRRASSGSSLSTLTADKQNPSLAFSSLQRCKHSAGQGHSNAGRKSKSRGGSAGVADSDPPSATVSPVLNGCGHRRSVSRSSCSNGHKTEIAKGTSGGSRLSFEPIHSFHMLQEDLGEFVFHLRQLDVDIASLRQDVGSVQENIATVRGSLDFTRERVSRLVSQVANVERQIGTIIKVEYLHILFEHNPSKECG